MIDDFVLSGESNNVTMIVDSKKSQPIGLGFRVPAVIVSPWTRGDSSLIV